MMEMKCAGLYEVLRRVLLPQRRHAVHIWTFCIKRIIYPALRSITLPPWNLEKRGWRFIHVAGRDELRNRLRVGGRGPRDNQNVQRNSR